MCAMPRSRTDKTNANLQVALAGEADANRRYTAYGIQALNEGHPEVAQLFFEAAGAETVHALTHLKTMGAIGSTRENLERAATGEIEEIDVILPRMIEEAEEEERHDAAWSFRLALERERHHRDMFRGALATFDEATATRGWAPPGHQDQAARPGDRAERSEEQRASADRSDGQRSRAPAAREPLPRAVDARSHRNELVSEPLRIERLGSIREVVFGGQDGLMSTFTVVAGLAAAGAPHHVVLLAGAVSAIAGILAMSVGTFLSSRAQRQVYEAELARERREIRDHPGEEIAELIASFTARGMSRADAVEVARRIARHPELLLSTLGMFELGLAPQRLGRPVRDAFVMAVAFGAAAVIPLAPFVMARVMLDLTLSGLLTVAALFVVGALKGRLAHLSMLRSGLEVVALGLGSGLIGFGLGRAAAVLLGVEIGS
jgi:rubrerythrin/VIT1/CCC1 family predicted Fe2+/Mn2+ transporter